MKKLEKVMIILKRKIQFNNIDINQLIIKIIMAITMIIKKKKRKNKIKCKMKFKIVIKKCLLMLLINKI